MLSKVWEEIIYTFPNFNSCTVDVWEWMNNFAHPFVMDVIIYLFLDYSLSIIVKRLFHNQGAHLHLRVL